MPPGSPNSSRAPQTLLGQLRSEPTRPTSHRTEIGVDNSQRTLDRNNPGEHETIISTRAEEVLVRDFARAEFSIGASPNVTRNALHTRPFTRAQLDGLFEYPFDIDFRPEQAVRSDPRRFSTDALRRARPTPEDSVVSHTHTIARKICKIFESNEPFSLYRQPVFHDPFGQQGYLNFRLLSPVQLAKQLRPYILHFRHALYLIQSHINVTSALPLPPYCQYIEADRAPTPGQNLLQLTLDCFDGYDVTGFYLLCELLWRTIAGHRPLFSSVSQASRPVAGKALQPLPLQLRTRLDSVLDIVERSLDDAPKIELALGTDDIPSLGKHRRTIDIPPPLQRSSSLLGTCYSDATPSDHFQTALRDSPLLEKAALWDHLQYLPDSPLEFDPEDPNLSIGLAQRLDHSAAKPFISSVYLRGGGDYTSSLYDTSFEVAMEAITSIPDLADYTTLNEYQQQTPSTYYSAAKPVLHLYAPRSKVVLQGQNAVSKLAQLLGPTSANGVNGSAHQQSEVEERKSVEADVTVESTALVIWAGTKGVRIEYPSIGIHGISTVPSDDDNSRALFLQLNLYDQETSNSDDDVETADVLIIPCKSDLGADASHNQDHRTTSDLSNEDAVKELYEAVSDCQNLHPDPQQNEDEEDAEQQPVLGTPGAPGEGGWITSENMAQFMDSNGNFVGFGASSTEDDGSAVAGTRRPRAEEEERFEDTADGETKWRRTE